MKLKMMTSIAGPDWSAQPGDIVEIEDAEALRHIEAGHAEPIEDAPARKPAKAKD